MQYLKMMPFQVREATAEYGNLALDVAADDIEITLFGKQK